MKTPETSRLFEKRIDPVSGVAHYLLKHKITKYQQGFYFCNDSMTKDGRYLWFGVRMQHDSHCLLGVIDFEEDDMYFMVDTLSDYASPYVDVETGDAYFTCGRNIYRRSPKKDAETELVFTLKTKQPVRSIATHLTRTADKKEFFLDVLEGNDTSYVGTVNLETGEFTKWADNPFPTNHGQINPVNPNISLCAYDNYSNIVTGEGHTIPYDENGNYLRLWTIERNGTRKTYPPRDGFATHEFWSADGKKIYYCDCWRGLNRINIETGEHIQRHACRSWHAFVSRDEKYLVYDYKCTTEEDFYRGGPAGVAFVNTETGKEIAIATALPPTGTREKPFGYHPDPHPRFVCDEKYILYTTSEGGGLDIALAVTADLIEKTR